MRIVHEFPPNYAEIVKALGGEPPRGVFFCYGDTIYAPAGNTIDDSLIAHEEAHSIRQLPNVEGWWRRYLDDLSFRFEEELIAHRVEYQFIVASGVSRPVRRRKLKLIARRLSGPLYGGLVTFERARKEILIVRT